MAFPFSLAGQPLGTIAGLALVAIWTLIWQGLALWHSAKNNQRNWFLALLVLNTVGLLPIIYLIWYQPKPARLKKTKVKSHKQQDFSQQTAN